MKTINIVVLLFAFAVVSSVSGQVSYPNNDNGAPPGSYLGWDWANDLDLKTDDILRMQLMQTQTSTINGFPGIAQGGFVGLSDELNFFNPGGIGPYSMLHINGDNDGATPQQQGWRPWMRYGMTVTSNRDLMYVGHLNRGSVDETDAVINWSDNTFGPSGPDNLRFIYTSGDGTAAPGDEDSFYGLEAGRFSGEGNFGCGDFSPSGANEQPTHQLDVNGQARVRYVPAAEPSVLITGREMTDVGDYVLHHLAFSGDGGEVLAGDGTWIDGTGTLCDWNIVGGGNDLATGYPGACVPGNVGIGDLPPGGSKLFITDVLDTFNDVGVFVTTEATATNTRGIYSEITVTEPTGVYSTAVEGVSTGGKAPYGGQFTANGFSDELSQSPVGVFGHGRYTGETTSAKYPIGVYGLGTTDVSCQRTIGVYGGIQTPMNCSNGQYGVAGYFAGTLVGTQTPIWLSDETVKTDITPLEDASTILQQLSPNSYYYIQDDSQPGIYSSKLSFGFIAQQVMEVLPQLVESVPSPISVNESGEITSSGEDMLGVKYTEFIPILVAGFQEQQARIQTQDDEIAGLQESLTNQNELMMQMMEQMEMLQQQINGCCNGDAVPRNFGPSDETAPSANPFGQNELYQNVPNPFRGQTTIRYTLEQGGRAMLNIHDSNGREIAQLENAEQVAGTYSYEWDATGLPAGTYHYSLIVDGELLVKRAIKLQD